MRKLLAWLNPQKRRHHELFKLMMHHHTNEERMAFFLLYPEAVPMFPEAYNRAHNWMRDHYPWEARKIERLSFIISKDSKK